MAMLRESLIAGSRGGEVEAQFNPRDSLDVLLMTFSGGQMKSL
jgi:hypothetical protein